MEPWERSYAVELSTGEAELQTEADLEVLQAKQDDEVNLYL